MTMLLHINPISVLVVRDGKRRLIEPSGKPFAFTAEEIAAAAEAGHPFMPHRVEAPVAVAAAAADPAPEPSTARRGRRKPAETNETADDDEEDGI
jgi:hypothetical protein